MCVVVVTPLSLTDWKLTFNGKAVKLHPYIGNWNFKCKSHYWIRDNKIELAGRWTEKEIRLSRENDLDRKIDYYEASEIPEQDTIIKENPKLTIWQKFLKYLGL